MARASTVSGVPALGWWLMAVGTVRLVLASSCFIGGTARVAFCSATQSAKPLYTATFLSFVYVYAYLLVEHLVYGTVRFSNLAALGFVAGMFFPELTI
ncbi:hypothetical protein PR202_ga12960 [Eleusine coracana subsp. coracana]|uniref:Uncharacterized protein n=1 Tax=Eleusine coracana subsp. coracana TaxID=191504 RepID=A0AAV5CDF6_ELECO|nr:hypothetical protein PR202_ga12960 [Eleusine coracana subsp. coracana]